MSSKTGEAAEAIGCDLAPDLQLNLNVRGLPPSATLAINERSNRLSRQGVDVYGMGLGQSPFPVPDIIVDELQRNAFQKDYLPVKGLLAFCEHLLKETRIAMLPGLDFGRAPEELTARLAYVNFDGNKALEAAAQVPASLPLDDNFLYSYCAGPVVAVEKLCEWLKNL